jgi:hypothetical protein
MVDMKVTAFKGIVENGQIRLPRDVKLPEWAEVYVIILNIESVPTAYIGSPRLVHKEQIEDFRMEVIEEPQNASL